MFNNLFSSSHNMNGHFSTIGSKHNILFLDDTEYWIIGKRTSVWTSARCFIDIAKMRLFLLCEENDVFVHNVDTVVCTY